MRSHGLPPPIAVIETDIVALKLDLMFGSDYLSFHAVDHLATLGQDRIRPLPFPEAGWQRRAGIIMRHGVEPNAATQRLIEIIEDVCRQSAQAEGRSPVSVAIKGHDSTTTNRRLN